MHAYIHTYIHTICVLILHTYTGAPLLCNDLQLPTYVSCNFLQLPIYVSSYYTHTQAPLSSATTWRAKNRKTASCNSCNRRK